MARRNKPDQPGQGNRRGRRQPYAREKDWQQAGDWSSQRSDIENPQLNQFLDAEAAKRDEFINSEMRVDLGAKQFMHKLVMSGDFNPQKIAAVSAGVGITFAFVAVILGFAGDSGTAVAALALALVPVLAAIGLAGYESRTRRIEAQAEIDASAEIARTKEAVTLVMPPTAAEIDVKPEGLLRRPVEELPAPRALEEPPIRPALDGGEPTS